MLLEREADLTASQSRNAALATRVQQHDHLLREAQAWLATFEQQRLRLHERYRDLTSESFPTTPSQ